jgi:thiol-disulfide isomerase/thioredoxin
MKRTCLFITGFFYFLHGHSQVTASEILRLSKKYYAGIKSGRVEIINYFKSPIAESTDTSEAGFIFCRPDRIYCISGSGDNVMLAGDKYYLVEDKKNTLTILPAYMKREREDVLERYPFYSTDLFSKLEKNQWKVSKEGSNYKLSFGDAYYLFDTVSYEITCYRQLSFSEHGLQFTQWKIASQQYYKQCNDSINKAIRARLEHFKLNKFRDETSKSKSLTVDRTQLELLLAKLKTDSVITAATKFILIDFFTQSCMPCIQSFPYTREIMAKSNGELIVIGIDPNPRDSSTMQKFANRYHLYHPILCGSPATKWNETFHWTNTVPRFVLMDITGKIMVYQEGFSTIFFKELQKKLEGK